MHLTLQNQNINFPGYKTFANNARQKKNNNKITKLKTKPPKKNKKNKLNKTPIPMALFSDLESS